MAAKGDEVSVNTALNCLINVAKISDNLSDDLKNDIYKSVKTLDKIFKKLQAQLEKYKKKAKENLQTSVSCNHIITSENFIEDETDSNSDHENNPPEISKMASKACLNLIPKASRQKYIIAYSRFISWKQKNKIKSFSEKVFLAYFKELSTIMKPPTLWCHYSMLKTTINVNDYIDISKYSRLISFLKVQSDGYTAKRAKNLTAEEINVFLKEAPDEKYLLIKAILAIGISGACRQQELWRLTTDDLEDLNSALLVKVLDTKTNTKRSFTVTGSLYNIYLKYASLRPPFLIEKRFFLNYQHGKCTNQVVGINKMGIIPKQVASFLKLPNPELYTGHSIRRSSVTISFDAGGANNVVGGYIVNSICNKIDASNGITQTQSVNEPAIVLQNSPASTPMDFLITDNSLHTIVKQEMKTEPEEEIY